MKARERLLQGPSSKPSTPALSISNQGKLKDTLARERAERNSNVYCAGNRMNRFGGVFVVPSCISSSSLDGNSRTAVPQIIRNPQALLHPEISRPQVNKKRAKKSFANINSIDSVMNSSTLLSINGGIEEQKALLVLAEFLETFLSSGFNELVYSVKEGWRREDPMKHTEELMYFEMVTSCLKYER